MTGFTIFVLTLLVLIIVTVISTAKIVPQGYNYTVQRLGRYVRTLKPGLGIIVPFIEIIGTYDPLKEPSEIKIDTERAKYWLGCGAQPSSTVSKLLKISGL